MSDHSALIPELQSALGSAARRLARRRKRARQALVAVVAALVLASAAAAGVGSFGDEDASLPVPHFVTTVPDPFHGSRWALSSGAPSSIGRPCVVLSQVRHALLGFDGLDGRFHPSAPRLPQRLCGEELRGHVLTIHAHNWPNGRVTVIGLAGPDVAAVAWGPYEARLAGGWYLLVADGRLRAEKVHLTILKRDGSIASVD